MSQGTRNDLRSKPDIAYVRETGWCVACRKGRHCGLASRDCECKVCTPNQRDLREHFKNDYDSLVAETQ